MCVLFGYIKEINNFCITPTVTGTAIAVMMEWPMMYIHVITCNEWASYTHLGFRQKSRQLCNITSQKFQAQL